MKKIVIIFLLSVIILTGCSKIFSKTIIQATKIGRYDVVINLLDAGIDVNSKDENGDTVLMWAAVTNQGKIVKILIDRGADIWIQDKYGNTVYDIAKRTGNRTIMTILEERIRRKS